MCIRVPTPFSEFKECLDLVVVVVVVVVAKAAATAVPEVGSGGVVVVVVAKAAATAVPEVGSGGGGGDNTGGGSKFIWLV